MEAAESLFKCLEQVPDPRRARGVWHPFQAILRLTLLSLVCGQTTMAHIALFARLHWPALKEPLGFVRDQPPHATTISRTLSGVSHEQLQGALTGWVAQVVADQELNASVDGKWAKQSRDANGNPLVMVNVLAHDLKLCLAQWPASEKRYEPKVLQEQLGQLFQRYPGLRLLTKDRSWDEDVHTLRRPGLGEVYATLLNTGLNALHLEGWFPPSMSMPLRAKSCVFRPTQTIDRLYGRAS